MLCCIFRWSEGSETENFPTLSFCPILVREVAALWKRPLEVTQSTVWALPSFTMSTGWNNSGQSTIWGWQRYSTRRRSFKRRGRRPSERFPDKFFWKWKIISFEIERLEKFNQGEERRNRTNAWLHLQSHRYFFYLLFQIKIQLLENRNYSVTGRFSGLHKLQILDFIFNGPTILGDLKMKRWKD